MDQRSARAAAGQGTRRPRPRRHARRRAVADVGPHPGGDRRHRRHGAGDPRRLRADGRRHVARDPGWRHEPRQHAARRAPRADRMGAARHPRPRRGARLRPRPGRTCSPRTERCWRRPARAASCATGSSDAPKVAAHGVADPPWHDGAPAGALAHAPRAAARAGRPRLHRHLVGGIGWRRRFDAIGAGRGVGAATAVGHGDPARVHTRRRR